jgi:hypothetical protein
MPLLSRQDRRDAAEGTGIILIGSVALVVIVSTVAALAWWLGVFTSGTKGAGDITRQRNSAANIAHWSATFNGLDQQITADQANIAIAKRAATGPDATKQDQINLEGVEQNCVTDVATYNGDIQNVLAVVPTGLPASIPTTVCGG